MIGKFLAVTTAIAITLVALAAGVTASSGAGGVGLVRPLDKAYVTQEFGCTNVVLEEVDRACPSGHWHSGIDLAAPLGSPVHAAASGSITVVVSPVGYGLHVIIDHGGGLATLYGHLSAVAVANGASVDAGEVIGAVGSTGNSSGPHLHFEIRRDGIPEDPRDDIALP